MEMDKRFEVLVQAASDAGKAILKIRPSEGVITKEGRANIVTAADLASEKVLMDAIHIHFPDDKILSEETVSDVTGPTTSEHLWVIDPIDGTNNFRYGRNYSAISIGYIEKGVIRLAAVYDPFNGELFTARRDKGAFLNEKRIQIGSQDDLRQATVATDNSYYHEGTRHNLELVLKIPETPWCMLRGSAVLTMCDVAAGRIDLYFHTSLKPWDNAAAFLIAGEAGAEILSLQGDRPDFLSDNVVMGNKKLVNQFLQTLK